MLEHFKTSLHFTVWMRLEPVSSQAAKRRQRRLVVVVWSTTIRKKNTATTTVRPRTTGINQPPFVLTLHDIHSPAVTSPLCVALPTVSVLNVPLDIGL